MAAGGAARTAADSDRPRATGPEFAGLCHSGAPRDRLFTSFVAELGPPAHFTVAVIEDAHWADEATVDLLSFLGRRLGRVPALLLATYRDDELAADHPLRIVLGDLATQRATRRMRLPPLSEDAVRELIGRRDVDAAELRRITGGNPFYVSEMLEAGWPSVPPTVRDSVGARLARASAGARRRGRMRRGPDAAGPGLPGSSPGGPWRHTRGWPAEPPARRALRLCWPHRALRLCWPHRALRGLPPGGIE